VIRINSTYIPVKALVYVVVVLSIYEHRKHTQIGEAASSRHLTDTTEKSPPLFNSQPPAAQFVAEGRHIEHDTHFQAHAVHTRFFFTRPIRTSDAAAMTTSLHKRESSNRRNFLLFVSLATNTASLLRVPWKEILYTFGFMDELDIYIRMEKGTIP
jgi:hypothetical protein